MTNIFVYGTLQANEALQGLIGRVPRKQPGKDPAILEYTKDSTVNEYIDIARAG
jgi:hypothetical protein